MTGVRRFSFDKFLVEISRSSITFIIHNNQIHVAQHIEIREMPTGFFCIKIHNRSPYGTIFQYSFFEDAPHHELEHIFRSIAFTCHILPVNTRQRITVNT